MSPIAPCVKPDGQSLNAAARRIKEVSTLPKVALHAMRIAGNPKARAVELQHAAESDPVLAARLLRLAAPAARAARRKITDLPQVIAMVGVEQVRRLAGKATVDEVFRQDELIGTYQRPALWRHSVSVAICARMLARRQRISDGEDAYLAGLLHDVGLILEDQLVHDGFRSVIGSLKPDRPLAAAEREHLGFDHTMLGEKLGLKWGFPDAVNAAIRYHHMSVNYRGHDVKVLRCVEVANLICTQKGISSVGMELIKCSGPALAALSLTENDLTKLAAELDAELTLHSGLFCA